MTTDDFVTQSRPSADQGDLLEQLLVVAAEKAAEKEARDALQKGFVTREQINAALSTFGEQLKTEIVDQVSAQLLPQVQASVQKAINESPLARKATASSPEEEREEDPVAYIIKKGREFGPDAFDDVDKQIIWGLTYKALALGMEEGRE
jgi:hypothetical protein